MPISIEAPEEARAILRAVSRDPELWLPKDRARNVAPALRLFCFPFAGGGASIFRTWSMLLPPQVEVRPIQLPGRENRLAENPIARLADLCPLLADMLSGALDRPYVLFGHSMGALIAYGVCLELAARGGPLPEMLIVSGRRAPHLPPTRAPMHDLPDREFTNRLRELGGTPPEVLAHDELMELMLPLLRADFALNDSAQLSQPPRKVPCPLIAFGAADDPEVPRASLEQWSAVASGQFKQRLFAGGHFYIVREKNALLAAIADLLTPLVRSQESA